MFARNAWSRSFGSRVAFADLCGAQTDWTGDRREFIGRNGTLADPAALSARRALSKTVGAGLDPCGALGVAIELPPGGAVEVIFLLGEAKNEEAARGLVIRYRAADLDAIETDVERQWARSSVRSSSRRPTGRWTSCSTAGFFTRRSLPDLGTRRVLSSERRLWLRDQLQDGMAIAMARPGMARDHLLRAAARQFVEGDVQHWWLPHSGQGVRTRISDDRPWLRYAVTVVDITGDLAVLDKSVPFLEGQMLEPGEHDCFFNPTISDQTATVFEHCVLALDASL